MLYVCLAGMFSACCINNLVERIILIVILRNSLLTVKKNRLKRGVINAGNIPHRVEGVRNILQHRRILEQAASVAADARRPRCTQVYQFTCLFIVCIHCLCIIPETYIRAQPLFVIIHISNIRLRRCPPYTYLHAAHKAAFIIIRIIC